jgi:putative hydrolase of the HAD superfamily
MKYKAVIFDLFGTLIYGSSRVESNNNLKRMAAALAVPADEFINLWVSRMKNRMNGTLKNYQNCIRDMCQEFGVLVDDDKVEQAASIRFEMSKREVLAPREGAIETLSRLKAKGYQTGLISNCSSEVVTVWKDSPLAPLLDVTIFSCIAGMLKPDTRIYQMAVEKLAVKPRECMYIADGMEQELTSAEKLGMHAVLIRMSGENDYAAYREEWRGPVISSLKDVLKLVR